MRRWRPWSATNVAEQGRDAWGRTWMEQLLQDLRYAFRALRRTPAFTVTALLSLALGIGAYTDVFSVTNGLMHRALLVREPERLVQLTMLINGKPSESFSPPTIRALEEKADAFTGVCGFSGASLLVGARG